MGLWRPANLAVLWRQGHLFNTDTAQYSTRVAEKEGAMGSREFCCLRPKGLIVGVDSWEGGQPAPLFTSCKLQHRGPGRSPTAWPLFCIWGLQAAYFATLLRLKVPQMRTQVWNLHFLSRDSCRSSSIWQQRGLRESPWTARNYLSRGVIKCSTGVQPLTLPSTRTLIQCYN